jgi:hypothetical protein
MSRRTWMEDITLTDFKSDITNRVGISFFRDTSTRFKKRHNLSKFSFSVFLNRVAMSFILRHIKSYQKLGWFKKIILIFLHFLIKKL